MLKRKERATMSGKMYEKRPEEDARYHDTWRLLKKYRDVTWSLELSIRQVKNQFRIDYDCSIEDFLESIYMAGADLGGTDIENHARCIERSYKMLTLLENSVNLLRTHHQSGEVYCSSHQRPPCGAWHRSFDGRRSTDARRAGAGR